MEIQWESLPDEVLGHIFSFLSLENRGFLCQVSHRFNDLLTNGSYGMPDIAVLNLFQHTVWRNNVHNSAGSKIRCVPLKSVENLRSILCHISVVNSLKLWFRTERFVQSVLDVLADEKLVRIRCLDVYPYSAHIPLELIREKLPEINAMTLRPHGEGFFWDGLSLANFPTFEFLDTLVLDSVNLEANAVLPPSITQLEWSNRRETRFEEFLPKLGTLPRLEYLLLGHVDFTEKAILSGFLEICSRLEALHFVVFRFAKFPSEPANWINDGPENPLGTVKVIKLDLCYGDLSLIILQLLNLCNSGNLRIFSLNWLYEDFQLSKLYEIIPSLQSKQISMQFGLLQKNSKKLIRNVNDENNPSGLPYPPTIFRDILWKLDMSFLEDTEMLKHLLSAGCYWQLIEMKFVNCPGVDDEFLNLAAKNCPRMRKLTISRCDKVTGKGVNSFLVHWAARKVRNLHIMWRHSEHPAAYYLDLLQNMEVLTENLKSRFVTKKLPSDSFGEKIIVWDKEVRKDETGEILPPKSLVIQDYGDSEVHWILGFAVPDDNELAINRDLIPNEDEEEVVSASVELPELESPSVELPGLLECVIETKDEDINAETVNGADDKESSSSLEVLVKEDNCVELENLEVS